MNREQARTTAEALQAFAEGKPGLYDGSQNGQYWMDARSSYSPQSLSSHFYYRFTPEKTEAEKLMEEWEASGKQLPLQYRRLDVGDHSEWVDDTNPVSTFNMLLAGSTHLDIRKKPEPTVAPWSFETSPAILKVMRKDNGVRGTAISCPDGVRIASGIYGVWLLLTYKEASEQFEQLDGSACGTTTEGAE